ncbi:prephenate dehydrogenase/arogenate dehydrogenase family protein [bacterium]|nr:prephenate dehydrogenase/arogenate dehydrogenase family protein [bacterium]
MRIGVIGLGLIGGSIFKNILENKKHEPVGISRTVNEFNVSNNYENLKECDLVFVCTPMNKTLEILDKLNCILDKKTVVTDVCSLKEFVSKKNYNYKFIPSHPMAGTEHSGWEYSFPDLFKGATWAITPREDTDKQDFELLKGVIEELGANVILTTPQEHDKAVALISHAPMLIAQALCKNIEDNRLAQNLASSGFRDTTRLALSNTEMANDMIVMNRENIKDVVKMLNSNIEKLFASDYKQEANNIKTFRQNLYE